MAFGGWLQVIGWRWVVAALGAGVALTAMACVTQAALKREAARGPRDAAGVMEIAAARSFDPPAGYFAAHPALHGRAAQAVLLIHGFVGGPNEYAGLGERLSAQGYHVRLMRLPGHGTSPADFAAQTSASLRAAVRAEYGALRAQYPRVSVGGFSMGGALATLLASETDVDRLMLFSPYFGVTYRWFYGLPVETWNAALGWAMPRYVTKSKMFVQVNRREVADEIYTYHVLPTSCVATLIALGKAARDPATLARIKCPVLIVAAEGDVASSPARIKAVYAGLQTAKKAVWFGRNINHQIFWDWQAEAAKQAVVDWLKPAAGATAAAGAPGRDS